MNSREYNRQYYKKNKHIINFKRKVKEPKVLRSFVVDGMRFKKCPSCLKIKHEHEYSIATKTANQPWKRRSLCKPCTSEQTQFYIIKYGDLLGPDIY